MAKGKLVFAHSVNVIGGAERVTIAIIKSLLDSYQCSLVCPDEGAFSDEVQNVGAQSHSLTFNQPSLTRPWETLKQQAAYWRYFSKAKPAAVLCGDLLAVRCLSPICRLMNIPLICHVHFPYEKSFINWALKPYFAPTAFIFCSYELKDAIYNTLHLKCPDALYRVIHNGVDIDFFTPSDNNKNPGALLRVGIIANLQKRKGHEDFIDMAGEVVKHYENVTFDIIGGDILDEPREQTLKRYADELGIANKVNFHGQVSNVLTLLHDLDVLVCASHEEAFPISMLEAMACGKAIVSTNVNGIPEALTDGENALLTSAHNPSGLATRVLALLNDDELRKKLGTNARSSIEMHFSQHVFTQKIQRIFADITKNN